jgi:hypothetical protein
MQQGYTLRQIVDEIHAPDRAVGLSMLTTGLASLLPSLRHITLAHEYPYTPGACTRTVVRVTQRDDQN